MSSIKRIYVFAYKDMYKIGISHNADKRLSQLKCGCPTISKLYESEYLDNGHQIEKMLHEKFAENRIAGEWFSNVDVSIIDEVIKKHGIKADSRKVQKREKESIEKALAFFRGMYKKSHKICNSQLGKNAMDLIDFDNGWKFRESDKPFLISFYKEYADTIDKECGGDGIEDICLIINSLNKNGVIASKELIQESAKNFVDSVGGEIYRYYDSQESEDVLRLIENSILSIKTAENRI